MRLPIKMTSEICQEVVSLDLRTALIQFAFVQLSYEFPFRHFPSNIDKIAHLGRYFSLENFGPLQKKRKKTYVVLVS